MKQTTLVMRVGTFGAISAMLMSIVVEVRAETYSFLGSSTGSWVGYSGSSAPSLVTTTPGSVVDAAAVGSSWGRLNTSFSAFPASSWRAGDSYSFHFDGVVSNSTFQMEFSNGAAAAPFFGLRLTIVNGASSGGDFVQVNALGGTSSALFIGNFGGVGGVGSAQRVLADITLSINAGNTATVSGSIADSLGNLWTGPNTSINLGTAPTSLFAGMNVNSGGGVSGINALNWVLTPVPEPSTTVLLAGLGLAGWILRRRAKQNR